jgi:hypothetical protein
LSHLHVSNDYRSLTFEWHLFSIVPRTNNQIRSDWSCTFSNLCAYYLKQYTRQKKQQSQITNVFYPARKLINRSDTFYFNFN